MDIIKTKKKMKNRTTKSLSTQKLTALLSKGPVMSESQFQAFQKTRNKFEEWKGK